MEMFRRLKEGCTVPMWGIGWMDSHQHSPIYGDYYVLYISLGLGRLRFSWQLIWNEEKFL